MDKQLEVWERDKRPAGEETRFVWFFPEGTEGGFTRRLLIWAGFERKEMAQ
jgi:hypothetical protein